MFSDSFEQIEHGEAASILDKLNPALDGSSFDTATARILLHPLPFYKNCDLIEVSDHDESPARKVSLIRNNSEEKIEILNGTNEPIYHLNENGLLSLNSENVKTYVRFFFAYVRGRHSQFFVVENADEVSWREEPSPNARKALGKMIIPLTLDESNHDNGYQLKASIIFKDSLFESAIHVDPNGTVTLSNQELLVEDIPVIDGSLNQ